MPDNVTVLGYPYGPPQWDSPSECPRKYTQKKTADKSKRTASYGGLRNTWCLLVCFFFSLLCRLGLRGVSGIGLIVFARAI